jgi:hypothetical protein
MGSTKWPASEHIAVSEALLKLDDSMTEKPIAPLLACLMLLLPLAACSHTEPLETVAVTSSVPKQAAMTDQSVIADAVGNAPVGASTLAWANPSTGSAGVIEKIDAAGDGPDGCRRFVTSSQSLEGTTRFDGVACPADGSWKVTGAPGLH